MLGQLVTVEIEARSFPVPKFCGSGGACAAPCFDLSKIAPWNSEFFLIFCPVRLPARVEPLEDDLRRDDLGSLGLFLVCHRLALLRYRQPYRLNEMCSDSNNV